MKAKTIEEVLRAGLWMIENVGWCQSQLVNINDDGVPTAFCAIGALGNVETNDAGLFSEAKDLLHEIALKMGYSNITHLNDLPAYSDGKRMVIQAYRTAIQQAHERKI